MNPTIHRVVEAYHRVATHATSIKIDRAGVVLPAGQHFQGIQRLPRESREPQLLVITSSSDTQPYFVPCAMAEDWLSGRASSPVIIHTSQWNHAGGCQTVGHFLVVGVENLQTESGSEVQFWDCRQSPPQPKPMTIIRPPKGHTSTAGAVGLSSFGQGAALAVASYNADTVDFYTSEADPFAGSLLTKHLTWKKDNADKTGWIDQNFGHYQNVNLITQTNGELFMVAFDLGGGTDWMDLFSVHLEGHPRSALKKLAKKKMYCTNGCTFNDGSGIFIPSSEGFEVYAVKGKSGDHATGTTIYANHFPAR
jgi:hypothetical protein